MTDEIPWTQIVTAIVAVYAAVVSTITLITSRKDKARKLNVSFSNGFLTLHNGISEAMLFITVSNVGTRSTTINIPYLVLPDKRTFVFPFPQSSVTYPHKLEDGTNCMTWIEMKVLADSLRQHGFAGKVPLIAEVSDATDRKYRSKKLWIFDTNDWK